MLRLLPPLIEPDSWTLAFHRTSSRRWVRLLAVGRYKHVSALAFVAPLRLWLVYDVTLAGTRLVLLPDSDEATRRLAELTADADLVTVPRGPARPALMPFYCVSAVKSLVGLRCGALLPDALWRHCLKIGGKVAREPAKPAIAVARSRDQGRAGAGAA